MQQLVVSFNPVPAAERVARWHGLLRSRLIMLAVALGVSIVIFVWQRSNLNALALTLLIVIGLIAPLAGVAATLVMHAIAKRDLAAVGEGTALTVDRTGVGLRGAAVDWHDLRRLSTRPAGPWRSPLLVVERGAGEALTLPIDYLDRQPSEIDNACRAYSGGRFGVDLAGMGV